MTSQTVTENWHRRMTSTQFYITDALIEGSAEDLVLRTRVILIL